MTKMEFLFPIWLGGCLALQLVGLLVWGDKTRRYVQDHGGKTAFFLYNGAGLRDYLEARRISERIGHKPSFLAWYERFQITAISLFLVGIVALLICQLR